MRPLLTGCAFVVLAAACSRNPPSPGLARGPAKPPPAAVAAPTDSGATLRLAAAVDEAPEAASAPAPVWSSLSGKTILHVGDSMVGGKQGLTKALEQKFTAEGATFVRDYKVSESIVSYDHSSRLKTLLTRHSPDILIITLGTNDVFVPFPASLAHNVRNIVKRIGARECYWIGPPTWKPDTGIVSVLKESVAPCKFFDSSNMKLQRAGDGIHPTDRGGAEWATHFWTYFRPIAGGGVSAEGAEASEPAEGAAKPAAARADSTP